MKKVVVISSYVATSRVGGAMALLAGPSLGVEPILIPTTLLGRHPGLGTPGGGAVAPDQFNSLLDGAIANGALDADAILTGYFVSEEQMAATRDFIARARDENPDIKVIVDPILGDVTSGVYVSDPVLQAMMDDLAPIADIITPNTFELDLVQSSGGASYELDVLSKLHRENAAQFFAPSTRHQAVVLTSVHAGGQTDRIGAAYLTPDALWYASTPLIEGNAPKGTGDCLAFAFTATMLNGAPPEQALAKAVGLTDALIRKAIETGAGDLPLAAAAPHFSAAPEAELTRIV